MTFLELIALSERVPHDIEDDDMKSGNNSFWTKALFVVSLFTAVSPIDAIPDLIPFLGQIDDAIAIPLLIVLGVKMILSRRQRNASEGRGWWQSEQQSDDRYRGFEEAKYAGEDQGGESFYNPT